MKKVTCIIPVFIAALFMAADVYAQSVEITGQVRPRYEMRHGYSQLIPEGEQAANFVSQRTRLNIGYADDMFRFGLSVQHIGTWGETGTMRMNDVNGASLHEAWGEVIISPKFSLKVGRQVLSYDDQRIMGGVDWAQQARSHDAALVSIKPRDVCSIDVGFAYNARSQTNFREYYGTFNYKALQFAHWQSKFGNLGASVLFLNTGVAWIDGSDTLPGGRPKEKVAYNQTMGFRLTYKEGSVAINGAFYYQTGKLSVDMDDDLISETTVKMSAPYFAVDASYLFTPEFKVGIGVEYLSGNSMKEPSDKDKSFKPWFGTNHKFNGWMDYFYVGNHMVSVGLLDIYVPLIYEKDKFSASLIPHFFAAANDIYAYSGSSMEDFSKFLGTEIDLGLAYAVAPNVKIHAGYSQMLATESMEVLKRGDRSRGNNWAWVMIDFKPTFFKSPK